MLKLAGAIDTEVFVTILWDCIGQFEELVVKF